MPDPDLEKNGGGGVGWRGRHPDPEISGGSGLQKTFLGPLSLSFFGLKIRGGARPYPGSAPEY